MGTAVKICGLMNEKVLPVIREMKPEYAGFVFAPSRRRVSVATARELIAQLPSETVPVGVFMNETVAAMDAAGRQAGLKILQLHGSESAETCARLRREGWLVWKAFPITSLDDLKNLHRYEVDGYLVDAAGIGGAGGTGKSFPWQWLVGVPLPKPLILAGGLRPDNVRQALEEVAPTVVDVSSGVEIRGEKSPRQIGIFIRKVRNTHDE
ncbi:phosphoribosylanthranilate isomerase [Anoxynatronum buryatiense]|uniref:N-(5'-phosphoribosyl)anthranilate isomerase n=1 Tax=Anoxynatronum buryatiense TaxID=489973 RepID=A0AA45WWV9_9CLOT|nr:phosphoribosylanthranilate isomerase [Anoxynatronum buryatiense]SMP61663.1 phosphoribosylanthranilate isomerase [Anoxynatronum buryatiense]